MELRLRRDSVHASGFHIPILKDETLEDAVLAYCFERGATKAEIADISFSENGECFMALLQITKPGWDVEKGFTWNEKLAFTDWVYGRIEGYERHSPVLFYTNNIHSLFSEKTSKCAGDEYNKPHRPPSSCHTLLKKEQRDFFLRHGETNTATTVLDIEPTVIAEWRRAQGEAA